jgi:hypothetical protein
LYGNRNMIQPCFGVTLIRFSTERIVATIGLTGNTSVFLVIVTFEPFECVKNNA